MSRRDDNKKKKKPARDLFAFDADLPRVSSGTKREEADASLDDIFDSYYTPDVADDPLQAVDPNFVEAAEAEAAEVLADLKQADAHQSARLANAQNAVASGVDSDYYFSVVFVSEAQKLQFLQAAGWDRFGGSRFLNGIELARSMGISLDEAYLATSAGPDKTLTQLSSER